MGRTSGKCVAIANSSTANGARVTQARCSSSRSQHWKLVPTSAGYHRIVNRNSSKCLVTAGLAANRGRVQQWGCRASGHQQWKLVPVETGSYRIIGKASGKCLEVASQRLAEGARLRISTCRNRASQRFRTPSVT